MSDILYSNPNRPFSAIRVEDCINSVLTSKQNIQSEPRHVEEGPLIGRLCMLGSMYCIVKGYRNTIASISSVGKFIDAVYVGIVEGITQANKEDAANKNEVFDAESVNALISKIEKKYRSGVKARIFHEIKNDLKSVYEVKLKELTMSDEEFLKDGAVEAAMIRGKGSVSASLENILRVKLLEHGDDRVRKLLDYTNIADAYLTAGSVGMIKRGVCLGQVIGGFLRPTLCSMMHIDDKSNVGKHLLAGQAIATKSLSYLVWASAGMMHASSKVIMRFAELVLSLATAATIGFFDGFMPMKGIENKENQLTKETDNNIEIKDGANNKIALGFLDELCKTYHAYRSEYEDLNNVLLSDNNMSELIEKRYDITKSLHSTLFRKTVLLSGYTSVVQLVDAVFSAMESVRDVTVQKAYAVGKEFGYIAWKGYCAIKPQSSEIKV